MNIMRMQEKEIKCLRGAWDHNEVICDIHDIGISVFLLPSSPNFLLSPLRHLCLIIFSGSSPIIPIFLWCCLCLSTGNTHWRSSIRLGKKTSYAYEDLSMLLDKTESPCRIQELLLYDYKSPSQRCIIIFQVINVKNTQKNDMKCTCFSPKISMQYLLKLFWRGTWEWSWLYIQTDCTALLLFGVIPINSRIN